MKRREFFKVGAVGALGAATAGPASAGGHGDKPAFVLVHGAWHSAWAWTDVVPRLAAVGYPAIAVQLPGTGSDARYLASYTASPIDPAAFATEVSPTAGVTQADRTAATVDAIKSAATLGNGKVVLVGHSWGGLTISHAAEAVPELIQTVVFLTAFMVPNGLPAGAVNADPSFANSGLGPLLASDPAVSAALRINPRSPDPAYQDTAYDVFYHDVDKAHFFAIANFLHPDEPVSTAAEPMVVTAERFGTLPRHFIRMADDKTIPAAAQDFMVSNFDGSGIGGTTTVHQMSGSHSPFFAQPDSLVEVFDSIAAG